MSENNIVERISGCRSDFEIGALQGKIEIDGFPGLTSLDADALRAGSPDTGAKAKRFEMIEALRAGKHIELSVTATTFRQRKAPNRRYLRLGADKFDARASTWKGLPFLTDHNTYEMVASKGTILASKAVHEGPSVYALEQVLHVVKPDAVIGFLDGTMNKFSIGWFPIGAVMCTAHGVDVRSRESCSCWPGVSVNVDGKLRVAEYEFLDYEGKETSGVVVPAVRDTSVDEIRSALAAELGLHPRKHRSKENEVMRFPRLAAALRLAVLDDGDEGAAVLAVEALDRRAAAAEQERDALRTQLADANKKVSQAEAALAAAVATGNKARIDAMIEGAYRDGKLGYGRDERGQAVPSQREARLRRIAGGPNGIAELTAELAEMEVVIPVQRRPASDLARQPEKHDGALDSDFADNPYLFSVAEQLGLKPEDMIATYERDGGIQ